MKSKCILVDFLISFVVFLISLVLSPFIASLFGLKVVNVALGLSFAYLVLLVIVIANIKPRFIDGYIFLFGLAVLFGSVSVNLLRFGENTYRNGYIRGYGLCNRLGIPVIKGGDRYYLAVDAFGDKILISADYKEIERDDNGDWLVEYTIIYHNSRGRVLDVRRWQDWRAKDDNQWRYRDVQYREKVELDNVKIYDSY